MSIELDLSDEVVLITGAGGGIGRGIVHRFRATGAAVVAADRDLNALKELFESDDKVHPVAFDVTDQESTASGIRAARGAVGSPTIVVNGAGVAGRTGLPFTRLDESDWQLPWNVNVVGAFNVSKAVVPAMIEAAGGSIINVASVSGRTGFQTSPPYSASKAAAINFTQVMARDLAASNIRVNSVCPGMVFTPFYSQQREAMALNDPLVAAQTDQEFFDAKVKKNIPLGRGQTAEDIANVIIFLASPLAASITGQALNVDGGLVMS